MPRTLAQRVQSRINFSGRMSRDLIAMDSDDDVPDAVPVSQGLEISKAAPIEQPVHSASGSHHPVPVLLITGFLGAGKTT
jgi:hypothetical protein